jgi:leader peptidase (prepilin peptidase)/N-methyltransferase
MTASTQYVLFAGVVGAVLGSFLNVVVYRLPRGESLVKPRSHCTACGASVKTYDNVPVLAWLWLRGRCRACRAAISGRYPLVELATGALCAAVVATRSSAAGLTLGLLLVLVVVPVALIDYDHHIIPNRITAPAALAAIALGSALNPAGEPERLIACAAAGGFLLLAHLISPRGMGMGDVKLVGVLGLLLGRNVATALLVALCAAVVVGVLMMVHATPGDRRKTGLPFGPFLALGGLVALFVGSALMGVYLHHLA